MLEQQVRRMLKDPKAEALAVNFAGQWLNLRGLDATAPLPLIYPDFDDPLRQAMRREVELLFDSIVREDRSIIDLLTPTTRSSTSGWPSTTASRTSTAASSAASRSARTWKLAAA